MADNKVVNAKTTEKTLRLDDKLLKKISDKAYSLRLGSDQGVVWTTPPSGALFKRCCLKYYTILILQLK